MNSSNGRLKVATSTTVATARQRNHEMIASTVPSVSTATVLPRKEMRLTTAVTSGVRAFSTIRWTGSSHRSSSQPPSIRPASASVNNSNPSAPAK